MDKSTFLDTARNQIPPTPLERLSDNSRVIMTQQRAVFDTHCHIFDAGCIDPKYFLIRTATGALLQYQSYTANLPQNAKAPLQQLSIFQSAENVLQELRAGSYIPTDEEWANIEAELVDAQALLEEEQSVGINPQAALLGFSIGGILDALRILRRNQMSEVLNLYRRKYAITQLRSFPFPDAAFFSTALMMDFKKGWPAARIKKSIQDQVTEMRTLANTENLLPFLFVDPRRSDQGPEHLYEVFLQAFTPQPDGLPPFFGVKVYPALGYLPSDARLFPIWDICESLNIPVLTHCGGSMVSTYDETVEVQQCSSDDANSCQAITVPGAHRKDRAKWLNDPANWAPVLQKHPKLRLNLAHFGGTYEWQAPQMGQRSTAILHLMDQYEHVYADFSFNLVDRNAVAHFTAHLRQDPLMQDKCLFGTDYWVVLPEGNLNDGQRDLLQKIGNNALIDKLFSINPKKWMGL